MGITTIFDGLYVDQLFHKNERGETVLYPHGMIGRGYRLPAEREAGMRQTMRLLMLAALAVGVSFAALAVPIVELSGIAAPMSWLVAVGAFGLAIAFISYLQSRLATGLEPVPGPRPTVGAWLKRGRQARARWTHWACVGLGLFALLMAAGGFALGIVDGDPWGFASGGFMLLVGGVLTWDGVLGLSERKTAEGTR